MASFRVSLAYSYLNKYLTLVIHFVTTIILARLLTPEDIGIYTVASVFVGLGHLLREFGINNYIVQEKDLTTDRIRAAFTLNLLFGWSIALILYFTRTPIGNFYESEAVREVIGLLCINFLLVPVGAITFAYLRREMRFQHTMIIQVASAIASAATGITAALAGEGYRSLVWSAIAGTLTSVIFTLLFRPKGVLLLPGLREIPHVFAFCRYAGSSEIIIHAGQTAPDWILGKVLDMGAVGLYSRAVGTINIFGKAFTEGLWGVILPHFSKQHRDGKIDSDQYLFLVSCITAVAWPFFATLAVLAEPVIHILFGIKWLESVPVLRILCAYAILTYTTMLVDQMLISSGKIRTSFRIMASIQMLTVVAVLFAARHGLIWVAAAVATVGVVQVCIYQIVGQRLLQIPFASFTRIYRKNILVTVLTVAPPLVVVMTWGNTALAFIPNFIALVLVTGLMWVGAVWRLKTPLRDELSLVLKQVKTWRRARATGGPTQ
ncbi:Membrane protein involved in the export of O-antigen and teichoic acid [Nitrosospira sp. Nsp14]|uniref:oligosaccharide flippase family protein n=1 Tax=Nitrosospira sp. Nsp14 TaxID=1855333 RepID=UPI0008E22E54|nr:oligosaccharide flippase family protein [Nitrosospira sp. Nsp14]SFH18377.1 Membrane protein involved in the export of O-antigen and teichoic acid [Nitrosospira sp. Nsp14]